VLQNKGKEVLQTVKEERNILHAIERTTLTVLVTFCTGTAFYNTILIEI